MKSRRTKPPGEYKVQARVDAEVLRRFKLHVIKEGTSIQAKIEGFVLSEVGMDAPEMASATA